MHKTLERQIIKYLSTATQFPLGWEAFIKAISDTYVHFDDDRRLSERSLELNSQELNERYQKLSSSLTLEKELQEKLRIEKESVEKKVEERTRELNKEAARLHASIISLNIGLIMTDINSQAGLKFYPRLANLSLKKRRHQLVNFLLHKKLSIFRLRQ